MKTRIFNLIILDASGSMESLKEQAVAGVNETIQTICSAQQKYKEQEHYVSLVMFNSNAIKNIYDRVKINLVKELTCKQYVTNWCTPLYDAIGLSLNNLRNNVSKRDKVLVTIITDGYENSSKEYNKSAIKTLVNEFKKRGWVFVYIGTNHDVEKVAASLSMNNILTFHATNEGVKTMFETENRSRSSFFLKLANHESFDAYFGDSDLK